MKKVYYNLITKIEGFVQQMLDLSRTEKITPQTLGSITRNILELHIPIYEDWKGEFEPQDIPIIAQFSE